MIRHLLFYLFSFVFCLKIEAQCPVIEGAMINSCGGGGGPEGVNEFLIFRTTVASVAGSYELDYGSNNPPGGNPTSVLSGSNARTQNGPGSFVASGCSIIYVTSPATVIPADSRVIFIPSDFTQDYDISSICNGTNIYIVLIERVLPSKWSPGGNFANSPGSTPRYLQVINGANNCSSQVVSYSDGWNGNADGNFSSWDENGNTTYSNNGCSVIPPVNPVDIVPQPISPVCAGNAQKSLAFTTIGDPDRYSFSWDVTSLAAGFTDINDAILNASPLTIVIPSAASAGVYTGSVIVKNSMTGEVSNAKTISIVINPSYRNSLNVSMCANTLPYSWNGKTYTVAGTHSDTLKSVSGCDSIVTLNLGIKPASASKATIAVCLKALPYQWNGKSYSMAGTYTDTLINNNGCDSIVTLELTVRPASASTTNVSICANVLPYTWNGKNYNAAGIYPDTMISANGCDSIATLNLEIKSVSTSTTNISACPNALPFPWNGKNYNAAGTYTVTLNNAGGCDSVVILNLAVSSTVTSNIYDTVCQSQLPFTWNGKQYLSSGAYLFNSKSVYGCDSVATLNLVVLNNPAEPIIVTNSPVCEGGILSLTASAASSVIFNWVKPDNQTSVEQNLIVNNASLNDSGEYKLTIYDQGCPSATATIFISVLQKPNVYAGPDIQIFEGDTVVLRPTVNPDNLTYRWQPDFYLLSPDSIKNAVIYGVHDIAYSLTVSQDAFCSSTDSLVVKIVPRLKSIFIPNAFSPNNDGINDVWRIDDLAYYPNAKVEVYNRYGSLVYRSVGSYTPWNGKYKEKPLAVGTYYYLITIAERAQPIIGWVTIFK